MVRLPLHYGKAPKWLFRRMRKLSKEIVSIMVDEYGIDDFLKRVSDPLWFQALGCVLGYDWHSSGVTTVVTSVLKQAIMPEDFGIAVCGGKGKKSLKTPFEIEKCSENFGFSTEKVEALHYASKMSAKVDNSAIQAGYQLYHHTFFLGKDGQWAVIQQGMCPQDRTARRYHWLSNNIKNFVVEPHNAIVGEAKRDVALDMTAKESEGCRKASVDISRERPKRVRRLIRSIRSTNQKSIQEWLPKTHNAKWEYHSIDFLSMPRRLNWKALRSVYEFQPSNYEELLGFRGIGPATIRGLALIAELIYGEKPSWKDPVKYSYAFGGKDGVPFPVNRTAMDESIQILKQTIQDANIGKKERMQSLQRLRQFVPENLKKF